MHDTFLLNNISEKLKEICKKNNIGKVNEVIVTVNNDSHINESNLHEHLMLENKNLITQQTNVKVVKDDIGELKAIIKMIQGEKVGE